MDMAPDFETLEIKTKSIEQTLLPLVKQISTLINHHNECTGPSVNAASSARALRAVARVGQAVSLAVDRFVTVGETIADDNPEIREDMYESCKEARAAGCSIEKLCQAAMTESITDRGSVVRAARCLLGSVTRVLLLADIVVVKQLLLAQDKVARSLGRLEGVSNFTEFVKAFSQFGAEMVELAHLTGDRHSDLKDGRRRAQMAAARQVLERSTMMLLTSSKTCLRHPECLSARENRDTVFCQMRRAMDLIHYVVKDGVLDCAAQVSAAAAAANAQDPLSCPQDPSTPSDLAHRSSEEDWDASRTVIGALRHFESLVELTRLTTVGGPQSGPAGAARERLGAALEQVVERTQDFTDSAYTSHEHRENILHLCDRVKLELNQLIRAAALSQDDNSGPGVPGDPGGQSELEGCLSAVLRVTRELKAQLQTTSMAQSADLPAVTRGGVDVMASVRNAALASDTERLEDSATKFSEHLDHVLEVCKLLRHVASTDALQVSAKYTEINLRIYGPQVVTSAHTLAIYPTSKIAKENLEVFADMWHSLIADVTAVCRDVTESCRLRQGEKQVYMSLPRPGKHGTTSKQLKPSILDSEEQAKIAKAGLEMKLITSEMDAETDRWQQEGAGGGQGGREGSAPGANMDHENNDIVKRAKNMSSMAFSMYQFTRGEGALKTTQDLFTQAEYFAEEANRLYKVVRQFSYQVPGGGPKKELLAQLDGVPTHVQQLQFTVKTSTVGKAATFNKVDAVITQTKSLMNVIAKVVSTCFLCATKYGLLMPEQVKCPVQGLDAWLFPAFLSPQALSRLSKTI